ncbi:hypothetical protein [Clostridium neonatale]|uniref:hypothetical protein n=1 Tax=Clostridium neonatale TaxID=137838 RepID=UPI00291C279D|nr:hypothetical protein [Clostridium neonatale]CAI3193153.1 Prophage ps2 protein [Clostridium neonatale]CAI3196907.1 Prophage ps2 protein [Clostridium neonatale]
MGIFTKTQQKAAENIYENSIKPHLKEKDGLIHVVMVNSFSKLINQNFGCEDKYTEQIDSILTSMQQDGYEIVNIKFTSTKNQGVSAITEGFNTLIMYK